MKPFLALLFSCLLVSALAGESRPLPSELSIQSDGTSWRVVNEHGLFNQLWTITSPCPTKEAAVKEYWKLADWNKERIESEKRWATMPVLARAEINNLKELQGDVADSTMPEISRVVVCPAVVLFAHDGDTITLAVTGARSFVGPVRLEHVFALELIKEGGKKAQEHLAKLLPLGTKVRVQFYQTRDGNSIESLCRPIAQLWIESTGVSVNATQAQYLKANKLCGGTGNK